MDRGRGRAAALITYELIGFATFIFLMFFNGYIYNWWNWLVALAANGFLAAIWPIYWLILRPFVES